MLHSSKERLCGRNPLSWWCPCRTETKAVSTCGSAGLKPPFQPRNNKNRLSFVFIKIARKKKNSLKLFRNSQDRQCSPKSSYILIIIFLHVEGGLCSLMSAHTPVSHPYLTLSVAGLWNTVCYLKSLLRVWDQLIKKQKTKKKPSSSGIKTLDLRIKSSLVLLRYLMKTNLVSFY